MFQGTLKNFLKFCFDPVDTIRLDTFRLLVGIAALLYMSFRFRYAQEWLTESGFHLSPQNLPYHDLWVPLLPVSFLPVFGIIFFGALAAFICGW